MTGFLRSSDEVVKEAEAAAVEGEAVDFPEVDADRKHEATLRDVGSRSGSTSDRGGVLIASRGARPELRLIISKAAQREMRAKWHADDHDAFAAQEERRPSW